MLIPLGFWAASAGGAAGSFDLLETQVLSSSAASVTFSGLSAYAADYQHLQIRMMTKGSPTNNDFLFAKMNFNSDTGANYNQHALVGNGSVVASTSSVLDFIVAGVPQNSNTTGDFCASVVDIVDPFETTKFTTTRTLTGIVGSYNRIYLYSGLWRNTNAISSISIAHETANFVTGSRFSLYGIKAGA